LIEEAVEVADSRVDLRREIKIEIGDAKEADGIEEENQILETSKEIRVDFELLDRLERHGDGFW
jgi:hypothetical protein